VNDIISGKFNVTERFITLSEAKHSFNLDRLPDGSGDSIRIVSVGDYDDCPCIGPHVQNTSEIGQFQLVSTSFAEGVLRIRFKLA
jgi:alanyl-tRNA synthetase